jgi:sialate O-acetylesterase
MKMRALLLAAGALIASPAAAEIALAPIWSDHIVVQQDKPIVVEGTAAPGAKIAASLGEVHGLATADADGHFSLSFPARDAGFDPLTLHVTAGEDVVTVSDILVGDVWLCSGQSNMELQVSRAHDSWNQIQASADDGLRIVTIPKYTSPAPDTSFGEAVAWAKAGPETVPDFSAACYYMAKRLRSDLKIPIGAIGSSWGGSQIRAWLTPEGGAVLYGADQIAMLEESKRDMLGAVTNFAKTWEGWWREGSGGQQPWAEPGNIAWTPVPEIGPWNAWSGTPLANDPIGNVFLRRTIELTPEQAAAGGTLNIGVIDDLDMTWVNGHPVGNTHGWSNERHYRVPAEFLKAGANEVIVVASNSWAGGGFSSGADRLSWDVTGGAAIPLGTGWTYSIGTIRTMPPRAPWDANAGIGVMHNKMIAPLGHITLKGAGWYQGESDVGISGYADKLRELFAGWRRQFSPDMQVLVIQLPNFGPVAERPVASGWAELREEQRKAVVADGNAALVPALDIGDRTELHPGNKLELGRRMARQAQGELFPTPAKAWRNGGLIQVDFTGIEDGLRTWSGESPISLELCADDLASCRFARASVSGDSIYIADDGKPATRIRYAWADSPIVNLYDGRSLPLPGFEIPIED